MLKSLHLCNTHRWRVRRYRTLRFQPGLNLLISPNDKGTFLRAIAQGVQIIAATHEILFRERACILELRRGYRERIAKAFCRMRCPESSP